MTFHLTCLRLLFLCISLILLTINGEVTINEVRDWANSLDQRLSEEATETLRLGRSTRLLEEVLFDSVQFDANDMLTDLVAKLDAPLRAAIAAADNIVGNATRLYEEDLQSPKTLDSPIVDADTRTEQLVEEVGAEPTECKVLGDNVFLQRSFVKYAPPQASTRSSAEAARALAWSEKLDETFQANWEAGAPYLRWQFIGFQSGVHRTYPGREWSFKTVAANPTQRVYNAYDPRFRPWYASSASGPKDVIIVLDASGSMKLGHNGGTGGQTRLDVARDAVATLVDTLSSVDFVNVVTFNEEAALLPSCFNRTLARASSLNKRLILAELARVEASDGTNFRDAFRLAFDVLVESQEKSLTSGCDTTIVFITDGVSGSPAQVIEDGQARLSRPARIFSFVIGGEADRLVPFEISAVSNGTFASIRDAGVGNVRSVISEYYTSFGRGAAQWSPPYVDATTNSLTLTRSVPLYVPAAASGGGASGSTDELLAVVGVDVSVQAIARVIENFEQGASRYAFLITHTGETIVHPRMPSGHASFPDILLLEVPTHRVDERDDVFRRDFENDVRDSMLAGLSGKVQLLAPRLVAVGDADSEGYRREYINVTYAFKSLPASNLAVCVVVRSDRVNASLLRDVALSEWRALLGNVTDDEDFVDDADLTVFDNVLPPVFGLSDSGATERLADALAVTKANAPLFSMQKHSRDDARYANLTTSLSHAMLSLPPQVWCDVATFLRDPYSPTLLAATLDELNDEEEAAVAAADGPRTCNDGAILQPWARADVRLSALLAADYAPVYATRDSLIWLYVATRHGVMRSYPGGGPPAASYDPTTRSWYRRAVSYAEARYTLSVPYEDAGGAGDVVTLSGSVHREGADVVEAVVGADMRVAYIYSLLVNATAPSTSPSSSSSSSSVCDESCAPFCDVICILFDFSGRIVVGPRWLSASTGAFLGEPLGALVRVLQSLSPSPFFALQSEFLDWNGQCDAVEPSGAADTMRAPPSSSSASSARLRAPLSALLASFRLSKKRQGSSSEEESEIDPCELPPSVELEETEDSGVLGCVPAIGVYSVNSSVIPSDTNVLSGVLTDRCLTGQFYISRVGFDSNLFLLIIDRFELTSTDSDSQCQQLSGVQRRSVSTTCSQSAPRLRSVCSAYRPRALAPHCACDARFNVTHDKNCGTLTQSAADSMSLSVTQGNEVRIVDCNANGDCLNGVCACDAGFDGTFCSGARRVSFVLSWCLLVVLLLIGVLGR